MESNKLTKTSYEGKYNAILTDCPTVESFQRVEDNLKRVMQGQENYIRSCRK